MDQTPCPFDITSKTTITVKNSKTVNARKPKTTGGTSATVCLTVTAGGEKLPAFVIFKGEKQGRLKQREIPKLNRLDPGTAIFSVQHNNWCDEDLMLQWVNLVWKPWVKSRNGRPTAIILDDYSSHKTDQVRNELQKLGTFVVMLPGGTTNHIQVLDVGINKPFKKALRDESTDWMMKNGCEIKRGRDDIAKSLIKVWSSDTTVTRQTIIATFAKIGYRFY